LLKDVKVRYTAKIRWGATGELSDGEVVKTVRLGTKVFMKFI
jgi:hypothetical protein